MADGARPSPPPSEPGNVRGGFIVHVLPALLWTLAIFIGGSVGASAPELPIGVPFDKVQHLLAFFGLQFLCFRALRYQLPERSRGALLWIAALVSLLVGIALELWQLGLPNRSAEVADAVADGIGAAAAALLFGRLPWP
jgi:VanZ family protein